MQAGVFEQKVGGLDAYYQHAHNGRFRLHKNVVQSFSQRKDKPPTILR